MKHPKYTVYVLFSLKDELFYIGYTANFTRRISEHAAGKSKSTAPRRPLVPILCEYYLNRKDAMRRELYFKTTAGKRVIRLMLRMSLKEVKGRLEDKLKEYDPSTTRFG